jgi:hypothetical protein
LSLSCISLLFSLIYFPSYCLSSPPSFLHLFNMATFLLSFRSFPYSLRTSSSFSNIYFNSFLFHIFFSMFCQQRVMYFLNVRGIYFYLTYIIDIMIILTVSRSSISCFFPAAYTLFKGPHDFSIVTLPSKDFSVYMTHKVNHSALGYAVFM